jgi:hypothetical protein
MAVSLEARENPFFPSKGEQDLPYTSNVIRDVSPLKSASVTLPSTARVVKKVTVTYENLDASLETKDIELNHSIDWHLPIFISQSYKQEIKIDPKSQEKIVKKKKEKTVYKKVASVEHAKFFASGKSLKIITADKLLRNFLLGQPHRIVMDFQKESSLKSYVKNIEDSPFMKIRVGNHSGYYRVVIELDGYYRYSLKKQADGCLITLR